MSTVNLAQVKELRARTSAGMMDCKKALEAAGGDIESAAQKLREMGIAKADKKASRIAAEGAVFIQTTEDLKQTVMVEINSETDFAARNEHFLSVATATAKAALAAEVKDTQALLNLPLTDGLTVEATLQDLVAKIGENIHLRRMAAISSKHSIGTYLHGSRIGVLVELDIEDPVLAKDIAMHIAASKPLVVSPEEVPADIVAKEKEIYLAQATTSGKPQDIVEKMVAGRIKKFLDEVSLLGQPFVKDPNMTIASLLSKHRAKVVAFYRFEVGEGIQKEQEDFVSAVMSQVQGS